MAPGLTWLAAPAVLIALAGCGGSEERCPPEFARGEWRKTEPGPARASIAREVIRCRFVVRLVGQTNGAMGPPDDQYLSVRFGPTDRVQGISIEP
jgi:hypothetical protein